MPRLPLLCLCLLGGLAACANVDSDPTPTPADGRAPNGDMGPRDLGACMPTCMANACGDDGCGGLCGVCEGDTFCQGGQCAARPADCGDGACGAGEDCWSCPVDCGACCGDGACVADHQERCDTCLADCGCGEGERCEPAGGACGPACTGDCTGRACGDDGCGGTCGDCGAREACTQDGRCLPDPTCGDGACDGPETCADCAQDCPCADTCDAQGRCVGCVPDCGAAVCGDDGCGGPCGACGPDEQCTDGRCAAVCVPDCEGRACGGDGCGGDCGACAAPRSCTPAGACVANCQPDCTGRACGDDGCGGTCGACGIDEICADGACALDCPGDCGPAGGEACDAQGARACVADPARPGCTTWSRRVPCAAGRACDGAACAGACTTPQLMVVLDRSAAMAPHWPAVQAALTRLLRTRGAAIRLGLRVFPAAGGDGCGAGALQPPGAVDADALAALRPPGDAPAGGWAAALAQLEQGFGEGAEAQAVVLLAAGPDGCGGAAAARAATEQLAVRRVRTYGIAVGAAARAALAPIAAAGQTDALGVPAADTVDGLAAALDAVLADLDGCACAPGARACDGDGVQQCAADGSGQAQVAACPHGCDPAAAACFPTCRPGVDQRCDGDTREVCDARGAAYAPDAACPLGCQAGACNPLCRPDTTACVDGALQRCAATGDQRVRGTECLLDCDGSTQACRRETPCAAGAQQCGRDGLLTCRADGRGFTVTTPCEGACHPGDGACAPLADGALRLIGERLGAGRVELFFAGQWGTVCGEGFDAAAAAVACRQAGFAGVDRVEVRGGGAGPVWVDGLRCTGDEARLADCPRGPLGMTACSHADDVAVVCTPAPAPLPAQVCEAGAEVRWRDDGARQTSPCPGGRCAADGVTCDDEPARACDEANTRACADGLSVTCGADLIERPVACAAGCAPAGGGCPGDTLRLGAGVEGPVEARAPGGAWQAVCADGFGPAEHAVVCRTLGLAPLGTPSQAAGAAPLGARCQGDEAEWAGCLPAAGCNQAVRVACRPPRPGLSLCEAGAAVELHDDGLWRLRQCEAPCDPQTGRCEGEIPPLVNFCRLQFPWVAQVAPGDALTVYARIYQAGLTDLGPDNAPTPRLIVEAGYGPDGQAPSEAGWRWFPGAPNPGYDAVGAGEPNNDEYQATVPAPAAGAYDLAWRVSMDGGRHYVFCDGQPAGSSDGYQPEWAGALTVE